MTRIAFSSCTLAIAALAAAVLAACNTPTQVTLDSSGAATLAALQRAPESAGALIYQGAVFPMGTQDGPALFNYERRIQDANGAASATHITRDASGAVVVSESARFTPGYEVQRFDAAHQHAGYSGSVEVTGGRHLRYVLKQGDKISTATEEVSDPVVTGPSLHGFILAHWDDLAGDQKLAVRMIVLSQKESYGFQIRRAPAADGRTAFSITPSSLLVRMAIDPLRVEFDTATRKLVRYQGRVPPMQLVDGKLKSLDAHVDYVMHAANYR
ncbi:MAG TPA: hypothetical protein VLJ57_10860 [Burkholderiaceae bacterium]|nr:hypothetical protein [Burkholderiaceae bacterium]